MLGGALEALKRKTVNAFDSTSVFTNFSKIRVVLKSTTSVEILLCK
jgi:hypothetical protein